MVSNIAIVPFIPEQSEQQSWLHFVWQGQSALQVARVDHLTHWRVDAAEPGLRRWSDALRTMTVGPHSTGPQERHTVG